MPPFPGLPQQRGVEKEEKLCTIHRLKLTMVSYQLLCLGNQLTAEHSKQDWNTARIDELIKVDRRVKLKEISLKLDIPKTNVYEIVHDKLGYHKVSAIWVPKMLSFEHKRQRVKICEILLHRCQQEGDETVDVEPGRDHRARNKLLQHLITGVKLVHLSTPETKRDSMTWKHISSPVTKKFEVLQSATK
ncbi:histone-lysine N-methyltransferase SETMAR [Plakobranchus ocellatus]|uniref:Histone-lysine N-methyltransferase SETMAR n=1 Tax=Plakobranchus ocellatus TaxID=259542 RepID=A0AAV4A762_9GAST|nr:histone-lysine N-methyltransferase SETMAR [Plakobranchus ocellatus]